MLYIQCNRLDDRRHPFIECQARCSAIVAINAIASSAACLLQLLFSLSMSYTLILLFALAHHVFDAVHQLLQQF